MARPRRRAGEGKRNVVATWCRNGRRMPSLGCPGPDRPATRLAAPATHVAQHGATPVMATGADRRWEVYGRRNGDVVMDWRP